MLELHFSESQRMEVFQALVTVQDQGLTVSASRKAVALRFGLNDPQVRQIEEEGLDKEWPPL
jgi:hypothetical protein